MANSSVMVSGLAEIVPAFAVDAPLLQGAIAKAYHDASMAGVNMRRAVEHLESLRAAGLASGDSFELFVVLDDVVALVLDDEQLGVIFRTLRRQVVEAVTASICSQLELSREQAAGVGYPAALAAALCYWRKPLVLAILDRSPSGVADPVLSRVDEWRHYFQQEQVAYFSELLRSLASFAGLDPATRIKVLVLAARIEAYQFENSGDAKEILDEVTRLAPDDPQVVSAYGEYWMQIGEKDKAEQAFKRAIELNSRFAPAYVAYGDFLNRQSKWTAAEEQYDRAIGAQPGDIASYRSLIELYGRPELFNDRVDRLRVLVERAVLIDPDNAVDVYGAAGTANQQNGHYDEARTFFGRAVEAAPGVGSPHMLLSRLDSEQQDYAAAEAEILRALEMAPRLASFQFELGLLYQQRDRMTEALAAFEAATREWSPWITTFAPLAADIKWKLGRHHEAAEDLLKLLAQFPRSGALLTKLQEFAASAQKDVKDAAMAATMLGRIREIKGEEYEATYRNRLGNMHYELKDYAKAADEYARACAADPTAAVYHSNLARVYQHLQQWDRALDELTAAFKLSGDQSAYDSDVANLLNDQALARVSRNEYAEALPLYREATRLNPDDAVLHANMAYVLERLETPDKRLSELDEALLELEAAIRLTDTRSDYRQQHADLQLRRDLFAHHGEPGLQTPASLPVVIEVGKALVPLVDSRSDGGTFLFNLVPASRARIERATGIDVPGFRLRGSSIPDYSLKIFTNDAPVALLSFPEHPPVSALIEGIERVVLDHMEDLVGIDAAAAIVARWTNEGRVPEGVAPKLGDPEWFIGLSRVLKALVRDRVPLLNAEAILSAVDGSSLGPAEVPLVVIKARERLKNALPGNAPGATIVRLPPDFESTLTSAVQERSATYDMPSRLRQTALTTIASLQGSDARPTTLVVSNPIVRMLLAQLIRSRLPACAVLTESELAVEGEGTVSGGVHG